jgi:ribonuclease HI
MNRHSIAPLQIQAECWTLYFDGSVMKTGAGVGLLFISPLGEHMRYAVRLHFPASNNMVEYEALLYGLRISIETDIKHLDVRGDSQLVIDQVMKNTSCHDEKMEAYCNVVRAMSCVRLKTSYMASSSTTSPASTMRRQTNWRRSLRDGSPFL